MSTASQPNPTSARRTVGIIGALIEHPKAGPVLFDTAGGLEFFRDRDVPICVHADELKNAFYGIATGQDFGAYLPHYMDFSFNWQPLHGDFIELFDGLHLHRLPGHTQALLGLRIGLANAGTFMLTSDRVPSARQLRGATAAWMAATRPRRLVGQLPNGQDDRRSHGGNAWCSATKPMCSPSSNEEPFYD